MKINSAFFMRRVLLVVLVATLPWVASARSQTTAQSRPLFSDRSTFLSGARAPSCTGTESNGCNCDNSQYRCRDPNSAVMCPNSAEGGCVTTVEGDPICASGGGKECSSSSDCEVE